MKRKRSCGSRKEKRSNRLLAAKSEAAKTAKTHPVKTPYSPNPRINEPGLAVLLSVTF